MNEFFKNSALNYIDNHLQLIYYGAPGTGKSLAIDMVTNEKNSIRTTFHPDSDYAGFVGAYKPTMKNQDIHYISLEGVVRYATTEKNEDGRIHEGKECKIVYKYVPQAFLKAYVEAWKRYSLNVDNPYYLIIEEINRGNCAQIFGDLFQLLDRNNTGSSSYAISADEDIAQFLRDDEKGFASLSEDQKSAISGFELKKDSGSIELIGPSILDGSKLLLPPNLRIWATMNTSDQSLFPIDSAFKRRWNWKYVPIKYDPIDLKSGSPLSWKVKIAGNLYFWGDFLCKVNSEIYTITDSTDKQLGYFFAKADSKTGVISEDIFLNKVLFYIWTDVLKDYDIPSSNEYFINKKTNRVFRFIDFFEDTEALGNFIDNFKLDIVVEEDNTNNTPDEREDWVQPTFEINGEIIPSMIGTVLQCMKMYFEKFPEISTDEAIEVWNGIGLPKHALETEQVFNLRPDRTKERASKVFIAPDGRKFHVSAQLRKQHMDKLMEKAKDWGIEIIRLS